MESKLKDNKPESGASWFEIMMIVCGITGLFSAMMWNIVGFKDDEPNNWLWFSRFALGIICLGFAGVIREIRKSK
jgi:hypothetical protein